MNSFQKGDNVVYRSGANGEDIKGVVYLAYGERVEVHWENGTKIEYRTDNEEDMRHVLRRDYVNTYSPPISRFESKVRTTLEALGDMLIEKNRAYGDSALHPVRIFSKADPVEQIMVRIDDKLSRLARGSEYAGDDTVTDLLGYLVLLKIARDGQSNAVPDAE